MKILIYSDFYKSSSGNGRIIRDLLPFLEKGNEIAFVALGYDGYPIERKYRTYPTEIKDSRNYWAPDVLQYAIRDFHPDIVLSSNDFFTTRKIAFPLAQPLGHKWVHWGYLDGDPLDYSCRESLKWVDYTLFFSDFAEREVRKVFPRISGERLYPPINPETFKRLDKVKLRKQFKLEDKKVLVTCGRNQQRKNIPILLDAMVDIVKKMPEVRLILASTSLTKTTEDVEDGFDLDRFIQDRGLDNYVINLGRDVKIPISDKLLNVQYNLSDLMVHPAWGEGFSLPIAEAGLCEVPTLGVDHSAVTEVVGKGGMVIPWRAYAYAMNGIRYHLCHPDDLTKAIIDLLNKPNKLHEMGIEARKFAESISPKVQAEKMLEIFERVLKDDIKSLERQHLNL